MRTLSEKALAIHREIGHRRAEAITLANLSDLDTTEGRLEEARARLEQALNVARSASLRRFEGKYLGELANLDRLQGGDLERAELLAAEAETLVSAAGQKREVAEPVCSRGHIALARGRSARELLELARSMTEHPDRSQLGKAIAGLSRAVEAFEAGEHHRLFRGELVAEMSEGLRRRFIEAGELRGRAVAGAAASAPLARNGSPASEGERRERPRAARAEGGQAKRGPPDPKREGLASRRVFQVHEVRFRKARSASSACAGPRE